MTIIDDNQPDTFSREIIYYVFGNILSSTDGSAQKRLVDPVNSI